MCTNYFTKINSDRKWVFFSSSSLVLSTDDKTNHVECCICQSKDNEHPLGLVVRLVDTGGKFLSSRKKSISTLLILFNSSRRSRNERIF